MRWVQEVNKEEEEEDQEERVGGKARMVERKVIKEKGQCLARVSAPGYILHVGGNKKRRGKVCIFGKGESVTL